MAGIYKLHSPAEAVAPFTDTSEVDVPPSKPKTEEDVAAPEGDKAPDGPRSVVSEDMNITEVGIRVVDITGEVCDVSEDVE